MLELGFHKCGGDYIYVDVYVYHLSGIACGYARCDRPGPKIMIHWAETLVLCNCRNSLNQQGKIHNFNFLFLSIFVTYQVQILTKGIDKNQPDQGIKIMNMIHMSIPIRKKGVENES